MTVRAVVVGGGLAGISAALRLADGGCGVTLLESKPKLGGLTHSFRRGDLDVDNGQHVFMRCCTSYRALLDRLGTTGQTTLQQRLDVAVVRAGDGVHGRLHRDALPAPLHLARALSGFSVLSRPERARAVRAALALRRVDRHDPRTDDRSFGDWLRTHGQSERSAQALWDLVGVATMNSHAVDASLAIAATVFQIGLLSDAGAADLGWSDVPLQQLHGDAAMRALAAVGAEVRTRARVDAIERATPGWSVHVDGGRINADVVVVATDPMPMEQLLPADAIGLAPGWSTALGASPIVNVHLVWDRKVLHEPFLAAVGSPAQWVFDRTQQSGLRAGQYLAVSISAADDVIDTPVAALEEVFVPEIQRLLPAARQATLLDFFVTRERQATFRPAPGVGRLRPPTTTAYDGLFLAGAHCATGWPATMESAVRSGDAAARAALSRDRRPVVAA